MIKYYYFRQISDSTGFVSIFYKGKGGDSDRLVQNLFLF